MQDWVTLQAQNDDGITAETFLQHWNFLRDEYIDRPISDGKALKISEMFATCDEDHDGVVHGLSEAGCLIDDFKLWRAGGRVGWN